MFASFVSCAGWSVKGGGFKRVLNALRLDSLGEYLNPKNILNNGHFGLFWWLWVVILRTLGPGSSKRVIVPVSIHSSNPSPKIQLPTPKMKYSPGGI